MGSQTTHVYQVSLKSETQHAHTVTKLVTSLSLSESDTEWALGRVFFLRLFRASTIFNCLIYVMG